MGSPRWISSGIDRLKANWDFWGHELQLIPFGHKSDQSPFIGYRSLHRTSIVWNMCTNPMINDKRQTPGRGVILTGKPQCWLRTIPEIKNHPFWSYLPASTKTDDMSSCNNRWVKWSLCQCLDICVKTICPKHLVHSNLILTSLYFSNWICLKKKKIIKYTAFIHFYLIYSTSVPKLATLVG